MFSLKFNCIKNLWVIFLSEPCIIFMLIQECLIVFLLPVSFICFIFLSYFLNTYFFILFWHKCWKTNKFSAKLRYFDDSLSSRVTFMSILVSILSSPMSFRSWTASFLSTCLPSIVLRGGRTMLIITSTTHVKTELKLNWYFIWMKK